MATPQRQLTPTAIIQAVLTARTTEQVEKLIELMLAFGLAGDRPIGDRDNNAGTIEIASNPYSALGERMTNGIDAELELAAVRLGYRQPEDWPELPSNPRDAARLLFNVPKAGIADLTEKERRGLGERIVVMLEESGVKEKPTVIVEDHGIGQIPAEMPHGLLSLNRSNKLRKPWQHGAYGQGGSATLRFSSYTIFVSRKAPDLLLPGEPDLVGWTVAYRDEGDPYKEALAVYRFYVGPDKEVPVFNPAALPDPSWHGTRIVHVAYELSRYSQAYTQLTNGAWGMFQSLFFDPVLPFLIGGRRQIDLDAVKKGAVADDDMSDLVITSGDSTRVVLGNKVRLDVGPRGKDPEIAWHGSEIVDLTKAHGADLGRLRVNYWVVRRPLDSIRKTDPTLAYVTADSAVTVTRNGQRHEAERRAWLKERVALPYLAKNLIVQVDIDELTPPARRELFSATRERMVDGPMKTLVYEEAVAALKSDSELRRLENEMRDRAMSKGAEEIADKVRSKLEKFVNTFLKNKSRTILVADESKTNVGPGPRRPGRPSPPRSTDDTNLPNAPTDMRFERDPIVITQGKRTTVWLYVDAKNGYLQRHEDDLKVSFTPELGGKVLDVGKSELLAGKSMWTLLAQPDAPLAEGEIEAILMTVNGLLRASAKVRVIAAPTISERKQRQKEVPAKGPNIVWVKRDEWDSDFNEKTVGQVNISDDNTDIRVNRDHRLIERALGDKLLSEEQVKGRANRYLFAVGCGLFRQEYALREGATRPTDEQIQAEQERMAEAVLMAIDDRMLDLDND
jgi:hypothetical protein